MDLFHKVALEEYALILLEGNGQEKDSEHVRQRVYERYEQALQEEGGDR